MTTLTIPGGDAGIYATLTIMRQLAHTGASDPRVRRLIQPWVVGLGREPWAQIDAIAALLTDSCDFLPDPSTAEHLTPPGDYAAAIAQGQLVQLDCDDAALLAAALGLTIGLVARFVVVGFGIAPSGAVPLVHIWTELAPDPSGPWGPLDVTAPASGSPTPTRIVVMDV